MVCDNYATPCYRPRAEVLDGKWISPSRTGQLKLGDVRFGSKADMCSAKGHVRFTPESGHMQCNNKCPLCANSVATLQSARWSRSVVLRSIAIGTAKRAPEKATTPLGLGAYSRHPPDRNGLPWPRDLILAARSNAGQHNLGILQANLFACSGLPGASGRPHLGYGGLWPGIAANVADGNAHRTKAT